MFTSHVRFLILTETLLFPRFDYIYAHPLTHTPPDISLFTGGATEGAASSRWGATKRIHSLRKRPEMSPFVPCLPGHQILTVFEKLPVFYRSLISFRIEHRTAYSHPTRITQYFLAATAAFSPVSKKLVLARQSGFT